MHMALLEPFQQQVHPARLGWPNRYGHCIFASAHVMATVGTSYISFNSGIRSIALLLEVSSSTNSDYMEDNGSPLWQVGVLAH